MPRAIWNGVLLAEAPIDRVQIVEGNVYFPLDAVNQEHLRQNETHTSCVWKGTASYYDVVVEGNVNANAAWFYAEPKEAAKRIAGHVAFWRGVKVES